GMDRPSRLYIPNHNGSQSTAVGPGWVLKAGECFRVTRAEGTRPAAGYGTSVLSSRSSQAPLVMQSWSEALSMHRDGASSEERRGKGCQRSKRPSLYTRVHRA